MALIYINSQKALMAKLSQIKKSNFLTFGHKKIPSETSQKGLYIFF